MSKTQMKALAAMSETEWRCAYTLRCSMATLASLVKRGLAEKRGEGNVGAFFTPRTTIEWRRRAAMTPNEKGQR